MNNHRAPRGRGYLTALSLTYGLPQGPDRALNATLPKAIELLGELIGVDTSFPPGHGYGALADLLERWFAPLGFVFERHSVPEHLWRTAHGGEDGERINLVGRLRESGPVCAMYFHTDVVPPGGNWLGDPFVLRQAGERLIGRGAADMKGAIAAVWAALQALRDCSAPLVYQPHLLFCTDEEGGAYPGIRYLAETGQIQGHLLSFNGQAAARIWAGCFGSLDFVIDVTGRSSHSGDARDGVNAVEEALPLLRHLIELKTAVEARTSELAPPPHWPPDTPLHERLTIAAVHGGHKGSSLPDNCRILVNRRYAPETPYEAVLLELEQTVATALRGSKAVGWQTGVTGHLAPVADPVGPHWPRWQQALSAGFGFNPDDFRKFGASSSSDMGWVQRAGIQEILLGGLVRPTSYAHGAEEFTTASDLMGLAAAVAAYHSADFLPDLIPEHPNGE